MATATALQQVRSDSPEVLELINKVRNHNEQAFNQLYERYQLQVTRTCVRMVGRDDAPIIVNETFAKVWLAISKFKGESSFYTWVTRIAINNCLMHHRKSNSCRKHEVPLVQSASIEEGGSIEEISLPLAAPDKHLEGVADRDYVSFMLSTIPQNSRVCLHLRFVYGLTAEEMMAALGISEPTAKSRLHHGLKTLRRKFTPRQVGLQRV